PPPLPRLKQLAPPPPVPQLQLLAPVPPPPQRRLKLQAPPLPQRRLKQPAPPPPLPRLKQLAPPPPQRRLKLQAPPLPQRRLSATTGTTVSSAATVISTVGTPAVTTTSRCRLNDGAHEAYMSLGLLLSIANDDNTEYFDMSSTFENFRSTINARLQAMFPTTFLRFNILMMSDGPIELTAAGRKRRKRQLNRATLQIVIGNAYFTESVARANIRAFFEGYTLNVDLKRSDGSRSSRVSYFSADHSIFGDTLLTDLNSDEIAYLTPIC
ncbi:unnamed protein product, partial [Adineta ricciae]